MSELKDFTRKLAKEKREQAAAGMREWHRRRSADRQMFSIASPIVKRVLREMANVLYGRVLWLWPLYSIKTISNQNNSDRGWHFFDRYTVPWDRDPSYARFSVTLREESLYISSRFGHGHFGGCSDVSETDFRNAVKKIVPDLI